MKKKMNTEATRIEEASVSDPDFFFFVIVVVNVVVSGASLLLGHFESMVASAAEMDIHGTMSR